MTSALDRTGLNSSWGYRRIHGELLVLGVKVAASTVWEILHDANLDPAPDTASQGWVVFLRSQAEAIIAADFFETVTLTRAHCDGSARYDLVEMETRPRATSGCVVGDDYRDKLHSGAAAPLLCDFGLPRTREIWATSIGVD